MVDIMFLIESSKVSLSQARQSRSRPDKADLGQSKVPRSILQGVSFQINLPKGLLNYIHISKFYSIIYLMMILMKNENKHHLINPKNVTGTLIINYLY